MKLIKLSSIAALCTLPILAHAHPGHAGAHNAFAEGLLHPLTGLDHALALFAIGLLAMRKQAMRWQLPLTFIGAMMVGVIASQSGLQFASVEGVLAASIVLLGLLLIAPREPMPIIQRGATLVLSLFALAHGYAHGMETSQPQSLLNIGGLLISTSVLTALGVITSMQLNHRRPLVIAIGALMTCFGLFATL